MPGGDDVQASPETASLVDVRDFIKGSFESVIKAQRYDMGFLFPGTAAKPDHKAAQDRCSDERSSLHS